MIEVKNITKKYGNVAVVNNVSFEVKDHEIVGFLGPNGAGKSTTMNMITGYIEPTKGRIIVNGYDISKSPKKAKKQIGYMPESVPLYNDLTVKEFINYMADLRRVKKDKKAQVKEIMDKTGLTKVQNKLIKNVSRGYKQRVSLAGALIGNPDVLILDEPTVGLDPKQITEIRELIKELGKNHTVILSSHILSEVSQICERVIIINNGQILAVDTPENLENKTKSNNDIIVTVEDKSNKMKTMNNKIKGITEIKLLKDNQDGTLQYVISAEKDVDIRKEIFATFPKEDITIFELKKSENTLEDAFLQIIGKEQTKEDKKKEQQEKRKEEIAKMDKKERKEAIREDKNKLKQEKKEQFEKEWEQDKQIAKEAKEEKKKLKQTKKEFKKFKKSNGEGKTETETKKSNDNDKEKDKDKDKNKTRDDNKEKTSNDKKETNKSEEKDAKVDEKNKLNNNTKDNTSNNQNNNTKSDTNSNQSNNSKNNINNKQNNNTKNNTNNNQNNTSNKKNNNSNNNVNNNIRNNRNKQNHNKNTNRPNNNKKGGKK